jgi:hypothetical protein
MPDHSSKDFSREHLHPRDHTLSFSWLYTKIKRDTLATLSIKAKPQLKAIPDQFVGDHA